MAAEVLPGMEGTNRVMFGTAAVTARDGIGTTATDMIVIVIVIVVIIAMNQGIGPDLDHRSEIPTGTELIVGEVHPAPRAEIGVEAMAAPRAERDVEAMSERGIETGTVITPHMIVEGMGTAEEKGTPSTAVEGDMVTLHTLHGLIVKHNVGVSNEIECLSISCF